MKTWITSDNHFYHNNIITYCDRPFNNVNEMNEIMIKNWNNVVGEEDIVYHLGDFALTGIEKAKEICEMLNGYKILVKGNHDASKSKMLRMGFDEFHTGYLEYYDNILVHNLHNLPDDIDIVNCLGVSVDLWQYSPIPLPIIKDVILFGHTHELYLIRNRKTTKTEKTDEGFLESVRNEEEW